MVIKLGLHSQNRSLISEKLQQVGYKNPNLLIFGEKLLGVLSADEITDDLVKEAAVGFDQLEPTKKFKISLSNTAEHAYIHIIFQSIPFLHDSLSMGLVKCGFHNFLSLQTHYDYDEDELCLDGKTYSYTLIQLNQTSPKKLEEILGHLQHVSTHVIEAVDDWQPMRNSLREAVADFQIHGPQQAKKYTPFLEWINEGAFTFLGYRSFAADGTIKKLGITKHANHSFFGLDFESEETVLKESRTDKGFQITKTMVQSTVHRPVPMDVVRIWTFDEQKNWLKEYQFFGLFTAAAYREEIENTPLVSEKARHLFSDLDLDPSSHQGQYLSYQLNAFPKDILFQTVRTELVEVASGLLSLKSNHKLKLIVVADPLGHFLSCMAFVPRDRYTAELLDEMGHLLAHCYKGKLVSKEAHVGGDLTYACVHYIISTDSHPQHRIVCDIKSTEKMLEALSLPWTVQLNSLLKENVDEEMFSSLYKKHYSPEEAKTDYPYIIEALEKKERAFRLYELKGDIHIKIFNPQSSLTLSETFPVLQNMGLFIKEEKISCLGKAADSVWVHHFITAPHVDQFTSFPHVKSNFENVLKAVFSNELENDEFNRLALSSNASVRHIFLVRAYYAYMRQIGWPYTRSYVVPVFEKYPNALKHLKNIFYSLFDPHSFRDTETQLAKTDDLLSSVESTEDETIFLRMLHLILATDRTNYFTNNSYISLKMAPRRINPLSGYRPQYEIFVYAKHVEGIHIRAGAVARGGIRWSDRPSDYRREIMDLMRAQFVKNAVIVPMGAKGGFYVKEKTRGLSFEERMQIGVRAYQTFINGLLDVVDNKEPDSLIESNGSVSRDPEDSYLVVAADKGTATFSDIANKIAVSRKFWLGDAFASGGSAGYDHKKMGITSRGAWESVKRHFLELGKTMNQPFTVIGVGDMSGDVFGNGLLYSESIKLVAAFNHNHIFIDPTPDLKTSYEERKRMFGLPRSGWDDYDQSILSKGGGIYSRKDKTIHISAEAQSALGLVKNTFTPSELISEILKAKVDLLWFGGIGTYVKSASETDVDVSDHTNDGVRVYGKDLRASVIGEGANLALTQKGRIEAAGAGALLFRDSVDNAAGVHCSDYEVNIKILFSSIMRTRKLTEEKRNLILASMTKEVGSLVLKSNKDQARAISLEHSWGAEHLHLHEQVAAFLEKQSFLNREEEVIPTAEGFKKIKEKGRHLSRPEVSVLISFSKLYLKKVLLDLPLTSLKKWEPYLMNYFPKVLQEDYKPFILDHPLKKEIVITEVINHFVNCLGLGGALVLMESDRIEDLLNFFIEIKCSEEEYTGDSAKIEIIEQYQILKKNQLQMLDFLINKSK